MSKCVRFKTVIAIAVIIVALCEYIIFFYFILVS